MTEDARILQEVEWLSVGFYEDGTVTTRFRGRVGSGDEWEIYETPARVVTRQSEPPSE